MIDQIRSAAAALNGQVVRTPLLTYPALNKQLGGTLYLKPENLQQTGSFKYRGAMNHIRQLTDAQRDSGVIAYSSGNHAQGVAKAASDAGVPATIVMPMSAPKVKIERTKAFGATVVLYDIENDAREEVADAIIAKTGAFLIPPYDHERTIAGQGTVGIEIAEQLAGKELDQYLVCCGGGGLAVGSAMALRHTYPRLRTFVCEPENFDDYGRSLRTGTRVANPHRTGSICDAIITPEPGALTFGLAAACLDDGLAVSDQEAMLAVAYAAQKLRLIVEPGGAVALAAALTGKLDMQGKTSVAVLSGGNIDDDRLVAALAMSLPTDWH